MGTWVPHWFFPSRGPIEPITPWEPFPHSSLRLVRPGVLCIEESRRTSPLPEVFPFYPTTMMYFRLPFDLSDFAVNTCFFKFFFISTESLDSLPFHNCFVRDDIGRPECLVQVMFRLTIPTSLCLLLVTLRLLTFSFSVLGEICCSYYVVLFRRTDSNRP